MPEDAAERYHRLSEILTEKIAAVPPDAWGNQSPCEQWTARDVVDHVVEVHGIFWSLVNRSAVDHPSVDEDPLGAFVAVRDQMRADLADPEKVTQEYDGLLGRSTFGDSIDGFVCFDLVIHGWDLSRATGQDESIDPRDVEREQAKVEMLGKQMLENGVIAAPVTPPPDASAQDRLLSALGRQV